MSINEHISEGRDRTSNYLIAALSVFCIAATSAQAVGAGVGTMSPKAAAVVMDQGSRLPAGYTQLEYIEVGEWSDMNVQGGFDLGVKADFQSRIEAKVLLGHNHNGYDVNLWGSRISVSKGLFVFGVRNGYGFGYEFSTNRQIVATTYEIDKPYLVDLDYKALTYSIVLDTDGQTGFSGNLTPPGDNDGPPSSTIKIFSYSRDDEGQDSYKWPARPGARIYYFRYFDKNGELIRDLVPVRRASDGEVCFYDFASEAAITKAFSTGLFVAGPAIKVADDDASLKAETLVDDLIVKDGATLDLAGRTLAVSNAIYVAEDSVIYERIECIHVDSNVVFKTGYKTQAGDQAQIDIMFGPDDGAIKTRSMVPFFSRKSRSKNMLSMWYWRADSSTSGSKENLRFDYSVSGDNYKAIPNPRIAADTLYRFTVYSGGAKAENLKNNMELTLNNTGWAEGTAAGAYMWLLGGFTGNTSTNEGTGTDANEEAGTHDYFCTNTKLYDFQVSNGGAVKCHFVPVKRKSDGAVGIYDKVGGLGFVEPTIVGSGKATAVAKTREQYKRLDSLYVENNTYFQTGYNISSSDRDEITVLFEEKKPSATGSSVLFGARSDTRTSETLNAMVFWHWWNNSIAVRFDYNSSGPKTGKTGGFWDAGVKYTISLDATGGTIVETESGKAVGEKMENDNPAAFDGTPEMRLLAGNKSGDTATGTVDYYAYKTRFYEFKATDTATGTLKCHFVPVKRASDGAVGIYDIAGKHGFVEATGTPVAGTETDEIIETGAADDVVETKIISVASAAEGITLAGTSANQSTLVLTAKNGAVDMAKVALSGNMRVVPAVDEGAAAPALANALVIPDGANCVSFAGFASPLALSVDLSQFDFKTRKYPIPLVSADGAAPDADDITVLDGVPKGWKILPSSDRSHLEAKRLRGIVVIVR